MMFYAEQPLPRQRQVLADVVFLIWVLLAIWLGVHVHGAVEKVAERARGVDGSARSLGENMTNAGNAIGETPLVGDDINDPFENAADSANGIADSASRTADGIDTLATLLALATVLVLVLLAAPYYLPGRLRFVLLATVTRRAVGPLNRAPTLSATGDEAQLFALRALAQQPLRVVRRVPEAALGWREGDPATIAALANLQLNRFGFKDRFDPTL